jgi:hypothetical protein
MMRSLALRIVLVALLVSLAAAQTVTQVATVRIDGRSQEIRQINRRWWSEDNRQLTQSNSARWVWWTQSQQIPEVTFHHHRPADLSRAESLRLFMDPDSVRRLLGEPNEISNKSHHWWYYATDGTALFVKFMERQLGEARYERPEYSSKTVASIERELNGRSIYRVLEDRVSRQSLEDYERYSKTGHPAKPAGRTVADVEAAMAAARPAPVQRTAADRIKEVTAGMARAEVIRRLGEPGGTIRVAGSVPDVETLTYYLDSGGQAAIRLDEGKVAQITQ